MAVTKMIRSHGPTSPTTLLIYSAMWPAIVSKSSYLFYSEVDLHCYCVSVMWRENHKSNHTTSHTVSNTKRYREGKSGGFFAWVGSLNLPLL